MRVQHMLLGQFTKHVKSTLNIFSFFFFFFCMNKFLKNEPRHEKTCLRGLRPGKTQTVLKLSSLVISDTASIGIILSRKLAYAINRFSHDVTQM